MINSVSIFIWYFYLCLDKINISSNLNCLGKMTNILIKVWNQLGVTFNLKPVIKIHGDRTNDESEDLLQKRDKKLLAMEKIGTIFTEDIKTIEKTICKVTRKIKNDAMNLKKCSTK